MAIAACGGRSIRMLEQEDVSGAAGLPSGGSTGASGAGVGALGGTSGGGTSDGGTSDGLGGTLAGGSGGALCHGFEEPLESSPLHCGRCDNDCRMGGCNAGRCSPAPTVLTEYPDRMPATRGVDIALDETRVYFLDHDAGRIASVSKDGGDERVLITDVAESLSMTVGGDFVYFAMDSSSREGNARILRMPKAGGTATVVTVGQSSVSDLTVVGGELYWLTATDVMRAEGGTGVPSVVAKPVSGADGLAVDDSLVYWFTQDFAGDYEGVFAADRFGRGEKGRLAAFENPSSIAVSGSEIFATSLGSSGVVARVLPAEVTLAVDKGWPDNVAVDETHVYFAVEHYEAILQKVPRSGGIVTTIASGHSSGSNGWGVVMDMAIDETRVFYSMPNGILSVPK
jgi:hypothetical protein